MRHKRRLQRLCLLRRRPCPRGGGTGDVFYARLSHTGAGITGSWMRATSYSGGFDYNSCVEAISTIWCDWAGGIAYDEILGPDAPTVTQTVAATRRLQLRRRSRRAWDVATIWPGHPGLLAYRHLRPVWHRCHLRSLHGLLRDQTEELDFGWGARMTSQETILRIC